MSGLRAGLLVLALCTLFACEQPRGDAELISDQAAMAEVTRIRQILASTEPFAPADFGKLEELRTDYPQADLLDDTYKLALYRRADWQTLEKHLATVAPADLNAVDAKRLAIAYFRQGKYAELVEHTGLARSSNPEDYDLLKLQAIGLLNTGKEAQAAELLDAAWEVVLSRGDVDGIVLRGRVHQRLGETDAAIEKLQLALSLSPQHKGALNALARIYFAQGDRDQAAKLSAQAAEVQRRATQQSTQRLHLVNVLSTMQQKWEQQAYREVIDLARQAIDQVDPETKQVVLQYIIGSHQRLGETDAARNATKELEMLQK